MCWGIPEVPVEVEMPKPKVAFLDALAQLCQDYDIAHIGIDGDKIIFGDIEGLNSISFMNYLNGKFVGVCQNKFMREYGKAFVAQNNVVTCNNENYFEIYQLKNDENLRYHRFTDYETLHKEGNAVESDNYIQVYRGSLSSGTTLEDIFTQFNTDHPIDFTGHSLSVSDIIVVHDNGDTAAYYIDSFRFKKVPEFLQLEQKAENVVTSNKDKTINGATDVG